MSLVSGMRGAAVALAIAALAGCGTVPLTPPGEDAPLFRRIDARAGTSYTAAARLAYVTNPAMRLEVGQSSIARFEKAFGAMFTDTVPLPDWPPWRHEAPAVDGVIELERADAELVLGDGMNKPDFVSVAYRVCLYEPNATEIRCWTPSARSTHQRTTVSEFPAAVVTQMEAAVREAIALFLVAAEKDPAVLEWAARVRAKREKP
jgi:hypothetical protein